MNRNKPVIITLVFLLLAATVAWAVPVIIIPPTVNLTTVEIAWTACPTGAENIISETIWVDAISFGVAGTGRTVTLLDKQGSPITVLSTFSLSSSTFTTYLMYGARFTGGMNLVCSGAGVVYQFKGKVRR